MEAFISSIAFRRSPIPQGGLEIRIVLKIFKSKALMNYERKSELLLYRT